MSEPTYLRPYSQHGQDKYYIERILKSKKREGYFVDLAAGDGVFISNTYLLEKALNWKGICIEANITTFNELIKNRNCICDNNVVLSDGKEVIFRNLERIDVFNHLESHVEGYWPNGENNPTNSTEARVCVSLNTLLNNHRAPEVIDYFSLDIEGSELEVLQTFFKENKTRRVLYWSIEHTNEEQITRLMLENGYKLLDKIVSDLQFILE